MNQELLQVAGHVWKKSQRRFVPIVHSITAVSATTVPADE
jgi:hypothetical protein